MKTKNIAFWLAVVSLFLNVCIIEVINLPAQTTTIETTTTRSNKADEASERQNWQEGYSSGYQEGRLAGIRKARRGVLDSLAEEAQWHPRR